MADTRKPNSRDQRRPTSSGRDQHGSHPHYELAADVEDKLKEIESGEPMSIAETISREEIRPVNDAERKKIRDEDIINVTELQLMSTADLAKQAIEEGVLNAEKLDKRELVSRILKERVKSSGIMSGHGTLQILPDGFGFLRSPEPSRDGSPGCTA